ncbi:hypothetical protein FJZ18_01525 [Candidatus Pacearchaeota archaeon]|nr:hypothetical protein [Candidatus Pacearchaeota archaeon]
MRCSLFSTAAFLFIVLLFGVSALHIVLTSDFQASFNSNEDISILYNISVNNTALTSPENISYINITLPSGFTYVSGSAGMSSSTSTTFSSSSDLIWNVSSSDLGIVKNGSRVFVWFNATAANPGNFNFTIITANSSGFSNTTLIAVSVNDTTPPSLTFNSPTSLSGINLSTTSLTMNVSVSDNGIFQSVSFYLYNASHQIVNSTTNYTSSSINVNFSGLVQGTYRINVSANDSFGNRNWSENRIFILDTTSPTVTLSTSEVTASVVSINITLSDSLSGVSAMCTSSRSGATISGNGTSQRLTESSLTCLSNYNYTVTCTDSAGNSKAQNATATTSACVPSEGNSGSQITSSPQWKLIFIINDTQANAGYTKELANSEAIRVKVAGEDHHVGMVNVFGQSVVINVSSTPQQATIAVGQTRQFDVNSDLYFDLNVTLISITSGKANLKILAVREAFPVSKQSGSASTNNNLVVNSSNLTINSTLLGPGSKVQNAGIVYWVALLFILSLIIIIVIFILVAYMRKSSKLDAQEW